jgi:hypothetical protein
MKADDTWQGVDTVRGIAIGFILGLAAALIFYVVASEHPTVVQDDPLVTIMKAERDCKVLEGEFSWRIFKRIDKDEAKFSWACGKKSQFEKDVSICHGVRLGDTGTLKFDHDTGPTLPRGP